MAQRQAFQGGGADASTTSFSKSYDRQMGNKPGTTKGNPDSDRREREGQDQMDLDKMKAMMNQSNQEEKL